LFRLLKLVRYTDAVDTILKVVHDRKAELSITIFMGAILLIISSTLVYYAECEAQPEKYSSILSSMWWSIITLLTVGYGDIYPITPLGKIFGALTAIFGIALFALPAGLITSGFMELLSKQKGTDVVTICPHCGKDVMKPHDTDRIEMVAVATVKNDRRVKP
jgi:voltage-gated potassium channel